MTHPPTRGSRCAPAADAPHGLYPIYAGLLPLTPAFRRALPPRVRSVTLVASICMLPPVLRDIMQWLGGRVVARRTFVQSLRERHAVVVVPGGQVRTPAGAVGSAAAGGAAAAAAAPSGAPS